MGRKQDFPNDGGDDDTRPGDLLPIFWPLTVTLDLTR